MKLGLGQSLVGTRLLPIVGSSFANQYSMEFDGVNDYVSVPDVPALRFGTGDFTISTWFKAPSPPGFRTIISKGNDTGGGGFQLYLRNDSTIRFYYDSTFILTDLANPFDNAWHHLVVTRIGTALVMYVDNSSVDTSSPTLKDFSSTDPLRIGARSTLQNDYLGNIDELSLWNKGLSSSEVSELYNNGTPANLASHSSYSNVISWWRMGENAVFRDPQWLLPSNENKDNYSNYSLDFDGVNDSISFITPKDIGETPQISYSVWVNLDVTTRQYLIGNWLSSNGGTGLNIITGDILIFQMADGTNDSYFNSRVASFSTYAPAGQWNHILATWDGTDSKIYINGVLRNTWTPAGGYTISGYSTTGFKIGWRGQLAYSTNGKLDEIGVFNSAVSVGDVWDGSGKPIDISTVSGITNNWRMGDGATFDGTNWTLPDIVGSKPGTTANMDISDRVGDAPGSVNNALSFNMDIADRVEEVPT